MRRQLRSRAQPAEHRVQAEVDALGDDERGRNVRRLRDVRVRARRVEHAAHRLRRVLRCERDLAVFEHELVEVAEVLAHVVVGDVGRLQHVVRLEDAPKARTSWSMTNASMSDWKRLTSSGV